MTIKDLRKRALMDGVLDGSGKIVDRLLDGGTDLPDVAGDFHITINGVSVCLADRALLGFAGTECHFSSLNSSFGDRMKLKAMFPAAIVAVVAGKCPAQCSTRKVA